MESGRELKILEKAKAESLGHNWEFATDWILARGKDLILLVTLDHLKGYSLR